LWAKRLKVDSAAELTALCDDVASLSASVGDLVRRQAAAASGLDQTLAASKLKLEEKANEAVDHIKGVVVRMSVVAALAVAAAIFALLALITGLVALYVRLEPAYGVFQALGIVGGVLAVIALVLVSAVMIVGRGRTSSRRHRRSPRARRKWGERREAPAFVCVPQDRCLVSDSIAIPALVRMFLALG
jgi:hypothetical protein